MQLCWKLGKEVRVREVERSKLDLGLNGREAILKVLLRQGHMLHERLMHVLEMLM